MRVTILIASVCIMNISILIPPKDCNILECKILVIITFFLSVSVYTIIVNDITIQNRLAQRILKSTYGYTIINKIINRNGIICNALICQFRHTARKSLCKIFL